MCDTLDLALEPEAEVIVTVEDYANLGSAGTRGTIDGSELSAKITNLRSQQRIELKVEGTWPVNYTGECY